MGHDRDDRYERRQKPSGKPATRTLTSSSIRRTGSCSRGARRGLDANRRDRSNVLHRGGEKTGPSAGRHDIDGFAGRGRKKSRRAAHSKQKREEGSEKRTHERSLLIRPKTVPVHPRHRRRRATNGRDLASCGPADLTPSRTAHAAVGRQHPMRGMRVPARVAAKTDGGQTEPARADPSEHGVATDRVTPATHVAAVSLTADDDGIPLAGESYAGKLSIAAAPHRQGVFWAADDMVRIERVEDGWRLHPSSATRLTSARGQERPEPSPGNGGGQGETNADSGRDARRRPGHCRNPRTRVGTRVPGPAAG